MLDKVKELFNEIEGLKATSKDEVEALRIKYLGQKGIIKNLFADFRNVPTEQKKEFGQLLNELRGKAESTIAQLKESSSSSENKSTQSAFDYSLPGYPFQVGSRHPLSLVRQK